MLSSLPSGLISNLSTLLLSLSFFLSLSLSLSLTHTHTHIHVRVIKIHFPKMESMKNISIYILPNLGTKYVVIIWTLCSHNIISKLYAQWLIFTLGLVPRLKDA